MSLDLTDDESTLVQVMAWCRQATSHYLSQCWHRSLSPYGVTRPHWVNTLWPRQNCHHFTDGIFIGFFLDENLWLSLKISLKLVPKVWINNIQALVQIMAWHRPGDKPLSGPMMVSLLMDICFTWPQWVKSSHCNSFEDPIPTDFIYSSEYRDGRLAPATATSQYSLFQQCTHVFAHALVICRAKLSYRLF